MDHESEEGIEYSDKDQLTAFMLSFFLGWFGAGNFYVGDILRGVWKILLTMALCLGVLLNVYDARDRMQGSREHRGNKQWIWIALACSCVALTALLFLWMYDWIRFALNDVPDHQGRTLYPISAYYQ